MLNAEDIRAQFDYLESTGWLRWKKSGKIAGCVDDRGYVKIRFNGKLYLAHRLIWIWMTGEQPPDLIDHDDGNTTNNRWDNLCENTASGNGYNRRTSRGIYQTPHGKWHAHIHSSYGKIHIGSFDTQEEAQAAYDKRRLQYLEEERAKAES